MSGLNHSTHIKVQDMACAAIDVMCPITQEKGNFISYMTSFVIRKHPAISTAHFMSCFAARFLLCFNEVQPSALATAQLSQYIWRKMRYYQVL